MRRRDFIKGIVGSATAWPLAARAQQSERMQRIGVLVGAGLDADDLDIKARIGAFEDGLKQLGWINGQNVRIDIRAGAGDADRLRRYAEELVALTPDVILATGAAA
jgi:putative tryptophan/tyrosine transport system substrate-binding protein